MEGLRQGRDLGEQQVPSLAGWTPSPKTQVPIVSVGQPAQARELRPLIKKGSGNLPAVRLAPQMTPRMQRPSNFSPSPIRTYIPPAFFGSYPHCQLGRFPCNNFASSTFSKCISIHQTMHQHILLRFSPSFDHHLLVRAQHTHCVYFV